MSQQNLMNVYEGFNIVLERGLGTKVFDTNGKEYLDFVSGVGVNSLGQSHPWLINFLHEQSQKLMHVSDIHWNDKQVELAEKLIENSTHDQVFFSNNGIEAVDTALEISKKYGKMKGTNKDQILFEFKFNDIEDIESKMNSSTCAVVLKPIQEESGIVYPDTDFLKSLKALCDKYDALIIYDEVQCGIGRTGKLFAYESFDVAPDILCISKGLGGGFPIGATLAAKKVANVFKSEDHGYTFEGGPLVSAVALTVLEELIDKSLIETVNENSKNLINKLQLLKEKHADIIDIQGMGLLLGIKHSTDSKKIIDKCLEKGLLLFSSKNDVISLMPPLNVKEEEINFSINVLDDVFKDIAC